MLGLTNPFPPPATHVHMPAKCRETLRLCSRTSFWAETPPVNTVSLLCGCGCKWLCQVGAISHGNPGLTRSCSPSMLQLVKEREEMHSQCQERTETCGNRGHKAPSNSVGQASYALPLLPIVPAHWLGIGWGAGMPLINGVASSCMHVGRSSGCGFRHWVGSMLWDMWNG